MSQVPGEREPELQVLPGPPSLAKPPSLGWRCPQDLGPPGAMPGFPGPREPSVEEAGDSSCGVGTKDGVFPDVGRRDVSTWSVAGTGVLSSGIQPSASSSRSRPLLGLVRNASWPGLGAPLSPLILGPGFCWSLRRIKVSLVAWPSGEYAGRVLCELPPGAGQP